MYACMTCPAVLALHPQDQPLLGADPVLWYSFGVTHAPRVEDFPVMPVEVVGFALKPDGFFAGKRSDCKIWRYACLLERSNGQLEKGHMHRHVLPHASHCRWHR